MLFSNRYTQLLTYAMKLKHYNMKQCFSTNVSSGRLYQRTWVLASHRDYTTYKYLRSDSIKVRALVPPEYVIGRSFQSSTSPGQASLESSVASINLKLLSVNDPEYADSVLYEMLSRAKDGDDTAAPNHFTFNTILNIWQRSSHPEAAARTMALFYEGQKVNNVWRNDNYTTLISIQFKNRRWDNIEKIFGDMVKLYKDGNVSLKPSMGTLKLVLAARSQASRPYEANAVFSDMIAEYKSGNLEYKPTSRCIDAIVRAWYRSGSSEIGEQAHAIYEHLKEHNLETSINMYTYGTLLNCLAYSDNLEMWKKGVLLFEEMKRKGVQLNLVSYAAILWTHLKLYDQDKENKELLDFIDRVLSSEIAKVPIELWHQEGETFTFVLLSRLKQYNLPTLELLTQKLLNVAIYRIENTLPVNNMLQSIKDPEMAEIVLNEMMTRYKNGNVLARPDQYTFRTILNIWLSSNHPDTPNRTLALFREGKKVPRTWSRNFYNSLISIQTRFRRWDYVEVVYRDMLSEYKNGNNSLKPSKTTMTLVLCARCEANRPDEAYTILAEMISEFKSGKERFKPNIMCVKPIVKAWHRSKQTADATERIRALFEVLKQEGLETAIDASTYGIAISCCAQSNSMETWKAGLRIFEEMKARDDIRPSLVTYDSVLLIHMKLFAQDTENTESWVNAMEQIISTDLPSIPDNVWYIDGIRFIDSVSRKLNEYKIPNSEQLIKEIRNIELQTRHPAASTPDID